MNETHSTQAPCTNKQEKPILPPPPDNPAPYPFLLGDGVHEKIITPLPHPNTHKLILYKYLSYIALKDLLQHGDLKISFRHDVNDPLEMLPAGRLPYEHRDWESGFMSFTQNANDPAMWGSYADKYKGARLRLEIPCFTADIDPIIQGFEQTKRLNAEQMMGCYVHLLCGPAKTAGLDPYCYRIECQGGKIERIAVIFKCLYQQERHSFKSMEEIAQESNRNNAGKAEGTYHSALIIKENAMQVAIKHTTWSHENEFRALVPNNLITRKIIQDNNIFLTNHFSPYISSITLAPLCPMTMTEAQILMQGDSSATHQQTLTLNRATFNKSSFLLDIPGEYQDGRALNANPCPAPAPAGMSEQQRETFQ